MTAAGAGSRTRRTLTAVTAGGLGLLGAVLGTAIGVAGVVVYYRNELGLLGRGFPLTDLLVVLVGLPLVAALGGFVLAGRQPPAMAQRPLE